MSSVRNSLVLCGWLVSVTILASACGQSSPTTPLPPPVQLVPAPAPRTFVALRLSGFVRNDDNGPVSDATLTFSVNSSVPQPPPPVATAGDGSYEVSVNADTSYMRPGIGVSIRADGYDTAVTYAVFPGLTDGTADFRLLRLTTVAANETADVRFFRDGSYCGLELEYACRNITIVPVVAGTLDVDLTGGDQSVAFGLGPVSYPFVIRTHQTLQVLAGKAVAVQVLVVKGILPVPPANQSVTVKTTLIP